MRQNYNQEYNSPVLESIDLEVEKGFAQSERFGVVGAAGSCGEWELYDGEEL